MNESKTKDIKEDTFKTINSKEIKIYGHNFDEMGKVFSWNNNIYRGIYPHKADEVRTLLKSGLIEELVNKGLFPITTISNYSLEGFEIVLKHEKIEPQLYPPSWTFDMLKDSALTILEINIIARKHGYQTIDCHGYNFLFKKSNPVFIDLGSFEKIKENKQTWLAYEEFQKFYIYPLRVIASGNIYLGRTLLLLSSKQMPHYSYYQHRFPILRLINPITLEKLFTYFHKYKTYTHYSIEDIKYRSPKPLLNLLLFLKKNHIAPFQNINLEKLKKKVQRIKLKKYGTQWGEYHDQFIDKAGNIVSNERFDIIASFIKKYEIKKVLEVGANQGIFAEIMLEKAGVESIIATDYDEMAVNQMYNKFKTKNINITPAVLDIVAPISINYGEPLVNRYKSEAVVALALAHHIILTQKIPLSSFLEQLILFSEKYLIIEFMPLGLYNEKSKREYIIPEWYTTDWFRNEFCNYFKLLEEKQVDKNRIVFVGELLN